MAIGSPKPVTFTQVTTNTSRFAPQPFVVVGDFPAASTTAVGGVKKAATIAAASTFADLAAATTAYNALLTALKNAGIMA